LDFREFFGTDNPFADLIAASCAPLDAFVGKDAQGFRPKQPSILKDLPITLAEAYNGTVKKLMINKKVLLNDGSGEIGLMDKVLTVKIPPGTPEGLEFSFPTEGDQDAKSTPGNIYTVIITSLIRLVECINYNYTNEILIPNHP
jgi:DnaJ family protein B protein 13